MHVTDATAYYSRAVSYAPKMFEITTAIDFLNILGVLLIAVAE
jgi:hypothetical protein